jgi:hypothetical protein
MSSRRSSAVIAMEVDSLWRKYLEAYKNYCSFPIKSLNFAFWAKICDIRRERYVNALVSAPEMVKNVHEIFRKKDMTEESIKKSCQTIRRWRKIKMEVKKVSNIRKTMSADMNAAYYAN